MKISVMIPCYNEQDNVREIAAAVANIMKKDLPWVYFAVMVWYLFFDGSNYLDWKWFYYLTWRSAG